MSHGGHGGGFHGARGRRFYGGGYYVDPFCVADPVIMIDDEGQEIIPNDDSDAGSGEAVEGGPMDRLAQLVAKHETYWSEIVERHPDSDLMRWWMTDRWSPFFVDWTDLISHHHLSNLDTDVLGDLLARLNGLRGEAQAHGIPIPHEGSGTAISAGGRGSRRHGQRQRQDAQASPNDGSADPAVGLHMSAPHEISIPEEINDETDRRFWETTGYKPGQKLDRHDLEDANMIPEWIRIRYQVALETAQRNEQAMSHHEHHHEAQISGMPALIVGRGGGGGGGRGFRSMDATPDSDRLLSLAPVMAAGARGAQVEIGFDHDTHVVSARVHVDGRTYTGRGDLSHVMGEITASVAGYHEALHGDPHAPAAIAGVANHVNEAISACGDALVGAMLANHPAELCAGWWHNLENKVKGAVNKVTKAATHYALHPSDIARDVASHLGAGKSLANALSYVTDPLQKITENPMVEQAAATYFGGPAGVAALQAAKSIDAGKFDVGNIGQTLKNFAPQIAQAAQGVAGNLGGPQAASLAGALVNATAGGGGAQAIAKQVVSAAEQAAAQDPQAKAVLDAAHQAVSQATVAHHVAQTVANAASGNSDAQSQLAELGDAVAKGDPAAAQMLDVAKDISSTVASNTDAAVQAVDAAVSQGIADLRAHASQIARSSGGTYLGVDLAHPDAMHFGSLDEADDWLADRERSPHVYVAIYDATDPTFPAPISESMGQESAHHVSGILPLLLAAGAGAGAGYYFGPMMHERLATWFPKYFASAKVSGEPGVHVGSGDCGARVFAGVNQATLDRIFQRLHDKGAEISGSNPWNVDTHDHGVILHGSWDGSGQLTLAVTDSDLLAPCGAVWDALESMLSDVGAKEISQ